MKLFLVSAVVAKLANDQNCTQDSDCESGNCSINNNMICKPKKENGEGCFLNSDCLSDRCSGLNGGECMERLPLGTRCILNEDCADQLFCNWFEGRGTCSGILRVTDRCTKDSECETQWCSYADLMTCQYKKRIGARCFDSNQCETGYCGEGFQCTGKKEIGAGCFRNTDCATLNCEWSLTNPWICASSDNPLLGEDSPMLEGEDVNV